jgi:hypothetical protein
MMTIQIFYGLKASPDQFMAKTEQLASQACRGSSVGFLRRGQENGYNFTLFLQDCPRNPATRKLEITLFKAIEGNDSFYVVQLVRCQIRALQGKDRAVDANDGRHRRVRHPFAGPRLWVHRGRRRQRQSLID